MPSERTDHGPATVHPQHPAPSTRPWPRRLVRAGILIAFGLLLGLAALLPDRDARGDTAVEVPRFMSVKGNPTNVRRGPSEEHEILWVYNNAPLPVEIIAEFGNWRRIRDFEGIEGWVFHSLLSGQRNVMVQGEDILPLQEEPTDTARTVALVQPGVLGGLDHCPPADARDGDWCFVDLEGRRGWLPRDSLYGVYPFEEVE